MRIRIKGIEATKKSLLKSLVVSEAALQKIVTKLKENTPVDTGEARDGWKVVNKQIVNDVEHISNLNEGSSQQAPAHFVEHTILGYPNVRPKGQIVTYL